MPPQRPPSPAATPDPTTGTSSTQPADFLPMIPENDPTNYILSFLKSLSNPPPREWKLSH